MLSTKLPNDFSLSPTQVAGCLVYRFERSVLKVLLLQHEKGDQLWGFPGGKFEIGEDALSCVTRELLEETGRLANSSLLKIFGKYYVRNSKGDFIYTLYTTEDNGDNITLRASEHKRHIWFSSFEASQIPTIPYTVDCIKSFEASLEPKEE